MTRIPTPILFFAWGTNPQGQWAGAIGGAVDVAKAAGIKAIALQASQAKPSHADEVRARQLQVVAWDSLGAGSRLAMDSLKPNGELAQIEGPEQRDGALAYFAAAKGNGRTKGIVTTYGGIAADTWARLADLGVTDALVECYAADDAPGEFIHADLDRMLWQGSQPGTAIAADALRPVAGLYRGELPSAYKGLAGREQQLGFWVAEMVGGFQTPATNTGQWDAWAKLIAPAPAPPAPVPVPKVAWWDVTAGDTILHSERATTYSPTDDGLGRALAWLGQNKPIIRTAKAVTITRVMR